MSYALGSHLVAFRLGYTHHGIYIGRGLVVHYLRVVSRIFRTFFEAV